MKTIAVLNGPNLNRLGKREPEVYGTRTLADLEAELRESFSGRVNLTFLQSNHEGVLVDRIGELADNGCHGLVVNPGAFTHTSVALRDALAGSGLPAVEVHLSNVHAREPFRQHSHTAPVCAGVITGLGFAGYAFAIEFLLKLES